MRCLYACLAALILAVAAFAGVPSQVRQKIKVINSTQAKGNVDTERLQECFWLLLQQQGLSEQEAPNVVILHVSRSEAAAAGVRDNVVRWESVNGSPRNYYQVWLIDDYEAAHYVVAFQTVIATSFSLSTSDQDQDAVRLRVLRMLNSTLSATKH